MDLYREGEEKFGPITSHFYEIISNHFLRNLYSMITEDIDKFKPETILDVGCGTGTADFFIANSFSNVIIDCIDPSPYMLSIASKKLSRFKGRVNFALGSSRSIPFEKKYDFVFSSISFHHWKCRENGLKTMGLHVKDNGVLAIYEYYRPNLRSFHKAAGKHALSENEIEGLNVDGFEKIYEINGEMVRILFLKNDRK
ncbi:hypothetical protein [Thermoplasma volcanium GSS1]|uniref:Methyltransferase type 12 domain-containing protein n=1 Tax=Thermoplasma volcanium (strain ATCC 51530 / DSM 4299 / JCM 9571 / NBRC 15438 / GSS1) TaxID=273116 RepID=Q978I5_THEVO|nr:methyltransferase [Thermoplasma volcanium]BAB60572.1 hypothetical protein [Thermoplasma volcanium GSS1]